MDTNALLDLISEMGYQLAMCGAETYRVEESIKRIATAYGMTAEVFSIPNNLQITLLPQGGEPMTRMRRIGNHGNDLDFVERFSNLSRKICKERPAPETAMRWLTDIKENKKTYPTHVYFFANFICAFGFAILFGGGVIDCIFAGICGIIVGLINKLMYKFHANDIFRIILASYAMAIPAYTAGHLTALVNSDVVITSALMLLVPGLLFVNAMRDVIYGDINSGTNRIVQVILIAAAIALGTGAAWNTACIIWGMPDSPASVINPLYWELLGCFFGCYGFFVLFNIHGRGKYLCALGALLTWFCFRGITYFGGSELVAYFWSVLFAAIYSEIMARIRKYPTVSYLIISIIPLIPGAGIYRTVMHAVQGDIGQFATTGLYTAAVCGIMAVAILLASTTMRIINNWMYRRKHRISG